MILEDKFLTDILKKKTGSLNLDNQHSINELSKYDFIYSKSKINSNNISKAKNLNFYLVTTSVLFKLNNKFKKNYPNDKHVVIAKEEHLLQMQDIAKKSFIHDRFHQDPNIPNKIASIIKKKWISNFFKNERGHQCFLYLNNNIVEGFLLTLKKQNNVIIDLIAVRESARGKGVGKKLINAMLNFYDGNLLEFKVETQINNMLSIKLYQTLGYQLSDYNLIWHYFKDKL